MLLGFEIGAVARLDGTVDAVADPAAAFVDAKILVVRTAAVASLAADVCQTTARSGVVECLGACVAADAGAPGACPCLVVEKIAALCLGRAMWHAKAQRRCCDDPKEAQDCFDC